MICRTRSWALSASQSSSSVESASSSKNGGQPVKYDVGVAVRECRIEMFEIRQFEN